MLNATNEAPLNRNHLQQNTLIHTNAEARKLYVGELDTTVDESDLLKVFSKLGKVSSLRISRDAITGISLGYGFIEYDPGCSVRLVEQVNVDGKMVRVMWANTRATQSKIKEHVIYLKNLGADVGEKALRDTFSAFGSVVSCTLTHAEGSETRATASLVFDTKDAAKKAIQTVNNSFWNGQQIFASSKPFETGNLSEDEIQPPRANLYVKVMDSETTDKELKSLFEQFGPTSSMFFHVDQEATSKGYGFVTFIESESAVKAIKHFNSKDTGDPRIQVSYASKNENRDRVNHKAQNDNEINVPQGKRELYIRNIDASLDEQSIKQEFEKIVDVYQIRIVKQRKHELSKRYGFVTVASNEDAEKLISCMDGKPLKSKPIHISFAHSSSQH
ncbi:hypothetical protein NQZ79_g4344 [Umbelopsis isabellina]|nr:hypothetical protein NQZ79_g4344 [Umbelopsis isabellina]